MFRNRSEAGLLLASMLKKYQNTPGLILAVPRGGVPVAYEVAKKLDIPLEIILVKKIGHPLNKEYAIGAVGLKDSFVLPHQDVTEFYVESQIKMIRNRLSEMQKKFMGARQPEDLEGETIIVIDDGIATGNTLLATIQILKKSQPAKIVVAAPVVSKSAAQKLKAEVDELVAILIPETFHGVGEFYNDFTQVSDEEVIEYLTRIDKMRKAG
jgi:putative phosphoribosyl transferase